MGAKSNQNKRGDKRKSRRGKSCAGFVVCLAIMLWVAGTVVGCLVLAGCSSKTLQEFCLADLKVDNVHFGVGYFGKFRDLVYMMTW